jgi:Fe-Mn family superoxide dismutase
MTGSQSRRGFLASLALAGVGLVVDRARAATPPKESGLSHEGLLAGRPGFQPRSSMPLPYEELPDFLSRAQLAEHHGEYVRTLERLKAAEDALRREGVEAGRYADLRRAQVEAANGVLLHECYFSGLAPQRVAPPRYIEMHMNEHMGSLASWREDFTTCALAARAWAVLVYDPYDDRWHNALMDSDTAGVWVGANPLIVCDVAAHAFSKDYPSRADYVAKFLDHVDWNEVSRRYRAVDRM